MVLINLQWTVSCDAVQAIKASCVAVLSFTFLTLDMDTRPSPITAVSLIRGMRLFVPMWPAHTATMQQ